jgi:hypothetical protein
MLLLKLFNSLSLFFQFEFKTLAMIKGYISVIIFLLANLLISQDNPRIIIDIPSIQKPWNNIEWNNDPERFQFAIVSDRTGGHRPGIFSKGIKKLNLLQPEFVMSVGDLIEGYTKDEDILDAEWKEFKGFIDELEVPFFYLPGNHDITNKVMEDKWKDLFGVTYYHFVYKDVLFLCLNSEDSYRGAGKGIIDDEQYAYIQKTLEENLDVKWTLVFLHQPLWVQENTKRWKDVEQLLADRPHNVFAGHYHRYWKTQRNNGKYIALATTGGGSRLRGTGYGEFDHVVWVTMTEEGPLLANLLLDGIWDENVVTDKLVDLVREKPFPVEIRPVYISDPNSEKVQAEVRITNRSDYPMKVNFDGNTHRDFFYKLEKEALEVAPNDVVMLTMDINNSAKTKYADKKAISLDAEITYDYEGNTDVVFANTLNFLPAYKNRINASRSKITVNGDLSDWDGEWISLENKEGSPFDYSGKEDCSVSFKTTYDDENVFIAIQVRDDEIFENQDKLPWDQDAIVLALDARPIHESEKNTGSGRGRDWLAIFITHNKKDPIYQADKLPAEMKYKINHSEGVTTVELSIPTTYLDKMQMKLWETFRMGIGYYDFDEGGESRTIHSWHPAWSAQENYQGSGMFFKE